MPKPMKEMLAEAVPQLDGTIELDGVHGPVEIFRDGEGVAHVRAGSEHDAFFGQGFVQSQDRLWQWKVTVGWRQVDWPR